ncbi:MAG TPA: siderophore-interacting protein [Actinophytocola sp.]|uniref:siderophore-interacting protein n=1 Tax=Actinophytocola sp. TaxID=1872138 RepID=UPI002DB9DA2A|nr:siderophore-interacting protein [Actinophytocola sp.]HEU5473551.1 siderophore-interacting protein [Actinophytocola sp.]
MPFRDTRMLEVRIAEVRAVTPRMREIRFRGPALKTLPSKPGAHLPIGVPDSGGQTVLRTYSVWTHQPAAAALTIRVLLHDPGGPGSVWASTAEIGDRLWIGVPRNKIVLDPAAPYHVFVGEETGAVPLLTMLAAVPDVAEAYGVLETTGPDEEFAAPGAGPAGARPAGSRTLPWVHRGGAPAVASRVLLRAVRELDLPARHGVAYVAGESATCRHVVRHLVSERNWPRFAVKTQAHWTPGRSGLV